MLDTKYLYFCVYLPNYSSLQCSWDSTVSVIHRDVVFHERRHGTHRRTFMHTNDANDNLPNSRRLSLQTITPVALIFSWLLFDGTTRKCIIRRWRSPTAIVIELLQLESRLFFSLSSSRFLLVTILSPPLLPVTSLFSIWHVSFLPRLFELTPGKRTSRGKRDTYPRINYERRRKTRSRSQRSDRRSRER